MTRSWRLLVMAAVVTVACGAADATAQTVMTRRVPAGERVEVMLNGQSVGSATAEPPGDVSIRFNMRQAIGKTAIDAQLYVDNCAGVHRVWIVEVGTAAPAEGTCNLRSVSGLYWVRDVNTIVVNDVGAAVPSILLLKGEYTPPPPGQEGIAAPARTIPGRGLVLFGGAGYVKTTDAVFSACGDVAGCSGKDAGIGYAGGAEFRLNRVISAEVRYLRPSTVTATGNGLSYTFDSRQNVNVYEIAGKIGVPAGIAKIYGRAGGAYHQAKVVTTQSQEALTVTVDGVPQTFPAVTQTIELKTDGWGWLFGGGFEVWTSNSIAIFGEFNYAKIAGEDVNAGEARIDNHLASFIGGLRIDLGR